MGAHALGNLHKSASGYSGTFTDGAHRKLNNEYYSQMGCSVRWHICYLAYQTKMFSFSPYAMKLRVIIWQFNTLIWKILLNLAIIKSFFDWL